MKLVQVDAKIKISASLFIQMYRYVTSLGIDVSSLAKDFSNTNRISDSPDERIPLARYLEMEEKLIRITGDSYFGLHLGEFAEPGSWSILGYVMMNCDSLEESILKLQRYSSVVGSLFNIDIENKKDKTEITLLATAGSSILFRHCTEAALSSFIRIIRYLTDEKINPLLVEIAFEKPESLAEYQRVFQCPVHFNTKETKIVFLRKDLRKKIIHSDRSLLQYFEKYAKEVVTSLDPSNKFSREVTELVLKKLEEEDLSIQSIAEEMGIRVRMLQLRLKEEGKTFRSIVKETRVSLAQKYLLGNYPVDEISYLLGFSEPSVFRRVFKKWCGLTPGEFKKSESPQSSIGVKIKI